MSVYEILVRVALSSAKDSWISLFFGPPLQSTSKLVNLFFFALTLISYGNICLDYTFALPLFRSMPSPTANTTVIVRPVGLDFTASTSYLFYLPELIYLGFLLVEIAGRFLYEANRVRFILNYMIIIDLLTIFSCFSYLICILCLRDPSENDRLLRCLAIFRLIRILKLCRYSNFVRQYFQTLFHHHHISLLLLLIFIGLCIFFGNLTYGVSLIDRHRIHSTPLDSLYYSYETILTIGFGVHIPSTPYLTWITITSVLFGMLCLSLPVPFLAIYNLNLDNYEQEIS